MNKGVKKTKTNPIHMKAICVLNAKNCPTPFPIYSIYVRQAR